MSWPALGEESVVRPVILDDATAARRAAHRWATEKDAKETGCRGHMDHAQMMAEWEPQQYASTETSGSSAAAVWALDG
jgi:hypothetical protein